MKCLNAWFSIAILLVAAATSFGAAASDLRLIEAVNLEIADLLIAAGANVKAATRYNITPLSLACTNGNATLIERLLKAGADADSTSEIGGWLWDSGYLLLFAFSH